MNRPTQLNDTIIQARSKILWFGMLSSDLSLMAGIYFLDRFAPIEPILPNLKNTFIGLCAISIAAPFLLLGYFKRVQNTIRDNIRLSMDNSPSELQQYITFLIIGMSLCSLPGMLGFAFYFIVGEMKYTLFFLAVSFCLGFLYQPELK